MPNSTCSIAIRCGGVPFRRFVTIDDIAYRNAAPSAYAMPSRYCPGIASTAGSTRTTITRPMNATPSHAIVDADTRSRSTITPSATSMNGCVL